MAFGARYGVLFDGARLISGGDLAVNPLAAIKRRTHCRRSATVNTSGMEINMAIIFRKRAGGLEQ